MISVCGADVAAWTNPAAISVEKLNSVQRVCSDELCIAYEAVMFRPAGGSKQQASQNETKHKQRGPKRTIPRRWRLTPPHLFLQ
jgi:hypothetical protein